MHDVLILHALILDHDFVYCCWNHHHHSVLKNWVGKYLRCMHLLEQYRYSCLTTQATREVMCGWLLWMWFKGCHGVLIYFTYLGIIDQHCISLLYGVQVRPLTIEIFWSVSQSGNIEEIFNFGICSGLHVLVKLQIRIKSDLLQAKH